MTLTIENTGNGLLYCKPDKGKQPWELISNTVFICPTHPTIFAYLPRSESTPTKILPDFRATSYAPDHGGPVTLFYKIRQRGYRLNPKETLTLKNLPLQIIAS